VIVISLVGVVASVAAWLIGNVDRSPTNADA